MSRDPTWSKPGPPFSWYPRNEVWTYASAAAPTFTLTIPGDHTMTYWPKQRVRLTQTTVKYFIITKVAYGAPNTTLTLYGGTDYALTNATIFNPAFSMLDAPMGFPTDPALWQVLVTDGTIRSLASAAQNAWYNLPNALHGSANTACQIPLPLGLWEVSYEVCAYWNYSSAVTSSIKVTLSNACDTEYDSNLTSYVAGQSIIADGSSVRRSKILSIPAAATWYLNASTPNATAVTLNFRNDQAPMAIRAVCAYL